MAPMCKSPSIFFFLYVGTHTCACVGTHNMAYVSIYIYVSTLHYPLLVNDRLTFSNDGMGRKTIILVPSCYVDKYPKGNIFEHANKYE